MKELTPRQIVEELDKYIVGQSEAKKSVAIAIRNRWRRLQLPPDMMNEVAPKNIIMIGPTGVGKTEIARRLANLVNAPFLKVEASKYTEVGYHGRDVESMIRDLAELGVNMVRAEEIEKVKKKAEKHAEEALLDILLPGPKQKRSHNRVGDEEDHYKQSREKIRQRLREGRLEKRMVEIPIEEKPVMVHGMIAGTEDLGIDFQNIVERMVPPRTQVRKVPVSEARQILLNQESEKLIDKEKVIDDALTRVENSGIIFIDEIDKIAGREKEHGPDVSREGVQRDLLPIIEGSTIATRHGLVRTDHILFIAAGAFHVSKPSDLIPEMQGRFPIRVELTDLGKEDFVRILTEPKNALVKQYASLLETENLKIEFTDDAIQEIAEISVSINRRTQNIGARRLQTVMEKLLEDISFNAPDIQDDIVKIDAECVRTKLKDIVKDEDLSRYIL